MQPLMTHKGPSMALWGSSGNEGLPHPIPSCLLGFQCDYATKSTETGIKCWNILVPSSVCWSSECCIIQVPANCKAKTFSPSSPNLNQEYWWMLLAPLSQSRVVWIRWHCVLHVNHQNGRKRHSSRVSVCLRKKERPGEDFVFSPCMELLLRTANSLAKPPEPCALLAGEGQGQEGREGCSYDLYSCNYSSLISVRDLLPCLKGPWMKTALEG